MQCRMGPLRTLLASLAELLAVSLETGRQAQSEGPCPDGPSVQFKSWPD